MSILIFEELKENLSQDLKKAEKNISIITAYCKKQALELIDSQILENQNISKRILVRFSLNDILTKATDLEIYDYCKKNNWNLYIQLNVHAKVYLIDEKICYMGSANATNNGLSIGRRGNLEMTKRFELDNEETNQIDKATIAIIIIVLIVSTVVGITIGKLLYDLAIANA